MYKHRIRALVEKLKKNNVGALLVTAPENIFYLTSFLADRAALVISPDRVFAVTDFIYAEAASASMKGIDIHVAKDSFAGTIFETLKKHRVKRPGFESSSVSFKQYEELKRASGGGGLIPTHGIIEAQREIKEAGEILLIKKAVKITRKAYMSAKRKLRPAATELSISQYIGDMIKKNGGDACSFEPIVAAQPLSSRPHHKPSTKKLGRNKTVLLDVGAVFKGYNSDLTRMCRLGRISPKFIKLYAVLEDAQKRAIELIKPGVRISDIDLAARRHIRGKGLGKFFGHALGHGVGLRVHEKPFISHSNDDVLEEGMVFTVEPGIYIPGFGGLRIEDMVRVQKKGCEILTDDIDKSI